jgi:hypothetical protein
MAAVQREAFVKKIVLIGLAAAFLAVTFVRWNAHRSAAPVSTSFSQIFIHGTPVCVFTLGGNVMARVGPCPDAQGTENDRPGDDAPSRDRPGMELPPGHPPVDRDMFPNGRRIVPI